MPLPVISRLRNRQKGLDNDSLVKRAIEVAQDPKLLNGLDPVLKAQVHPVVKALQVGSGWTQQRGAAAPRVSAATLAQRAHQVLGPSSGITPPDIAAALIEQGLDWVEPFPPGQPLTPYYGYGRRPRQLPYQTGYNITTEPRPFRMPFATLYTLWKSYDVAAACTRYSINDLRSMRLRFEAMDGYEDNPIKEIAEAKRFLRRPDGFNTTRNFIAQNQRNLWIFDSAPIFRLKDNAGRLKQLKNVTPMTIAPVLDYFGDIPDGEAPAYQQFITGIPWDWLKRENIIYQPFWPQTDSPYGTPPLETVLVNANTDLRLQLFFLQFFTATAVPEMFAITPEGMSSKEDLADFQEQWEGEFTGTQSKRHGLKFLPHDTTLFPYKPQQFDPDLAEYVMRRTISAFGLVPQNLGILEDVNRASCHSEDTEVLTEAGWKHYWDVSPSERIATFNPATQALEYHTPDALHVYDYDGTMVHFRSLGVDCLVTPNHKMWVGNRSRELPRGASGYVRPPWERVEARDLTSRGGDFWFADHVVWEGGEEQDWFVLPAVEAGSHRRLERRVPMDAWLEFLGYVVSEGCIFGDGSDHRYRVSVSQNVRANPEKVRTIQACLDELPVEFAAYTDRGDTVRWQVSDKSLWTWLRENVGHYSADKRLPSLWRSLGKRQLEILFEALMLGDGYTDPKPNASNRSYSTKSHRLADDVQELCLRLGYRAQRTTNLSGRVYRVNITSRPRRGHQLRARNLQSVPYRGHVWCFSVPPHHLFLTRRNGKVLVAGNSDTQMDQQFRVSTLPIVGYYEDLFDSILQDTLTLPVQIRFDTGREKEDRLMEARAHLIYWQMGAESADEVREKILGYPVNPEERLPRGVMDQRLGWIPAAHQIAVAGDVDPLTGVPLPGTVSPMPYQLPGGGTPVPAEGPQGGGADPKAPHPSQSDPTKVYPRPLYPPGRGATKEQSGGTPEDSDNDGPDAYVGYGLWDIPHGSSGQGTGAQHPPVSIEEAADLRKWREQSRRRVAEGRTPRAFADSAIDHVRYERVWKCLAVARTREAVDDAFAKAREPIAAGIVVQAADTGRVLMVQRSYTKHDPGEARARWEFPGGKLTGNDPWTGALREWSEETGASLPTGYEHRGTWTSPDGLYVGHVVTVPSEHLVHLNPQREEVSDARWWSKDELDDPEVRDKVTDTLDRVKPLLKATTTPRQTLRQQVHAQTTAAVQQFTPQVQAALTAMLPVAVLTPALAPLGVGAAGITAALTLIGKALKVGALVAVIALIYAAAWSRGGLTGRPPRDKLTPTYWVRKIRQTVLDRVEQIIRDGVAAGLTSAQIAAEIEKYLSAEWHAEQIADTEYVRAWHLAAMESYIRGGVEQLEWIHQPGACPRCMENVAASPQPARDPQWPQGPIPVHPGTRCAVVPYREAA